MRKKEFTKNRYMTFLLSALFLLFASCQNSSQPDHQQVVLPDGIAPVCGAAMPTDGQSVGDDLPSNAASVLGFQTMLPTYIPHGLSWNHYVLTSSTWGKYHPGATAPLFRAAYRVWEPLNEKNTFGSLIVLILDETQTTMKPFTNIVDTLSIKDQTDITIKGDKGVFYHLVSGVSNVAAPQVSEIIWQSNNVTFRLITLAKGSITLHNSALVDTLTARPDINDSVLLQIANSIKPYNVCG